MVIEIGYVCHADMVYGTVWLAICTSITRIPTTTTEKSGKNTGNKKNESASYVHAISTERTNSRGNFPIFSKRVFFFWLSATIDT
jgi:hypothetical protein